MAKVRKKSNVNGRRSAGDRCMSCGAPCWRCDVWYCWECYKYQYYESK
ncbi:hypothetical protein [Butyrivibrio sp. VCD2006]|nr:hypothetical protein [Butyrivibrio sp. VCD2006]